MNGPLGPAGETPRLLDRLADWLAANGRYAAAVVRGSAQPTERRRADVRRALLTGRTANTEWREAFARAQHEPVRHRGPTRGEAERAQAALRSLGRAAMLLETYLPEGDARPVPEAERLADALEADTTQAARDVRKRRNPGWDRVEEALDQWDGAGTDADPLVRRGAELQLQALEDLTTAVSRTPPGTRRRTSQGGTA